MNNDTITSDPVQIIENAMLNNEQLSEKTKGILSSALNTYKSGKRVWNKEERKAVFEAVDFSKLN